MNKNELIDNLDQAGIDRSHYSLSGELLPDTVVLSEYYGKWEFFYLDERGTQHNLEFFQNEIDAYEHVYQYLTRFQQ